MSLGFPGGSAANAGDLGSIPGLGRSPGEGKDYPLQYFGLENSTDCIVHGWQRVGHNWVTLTFRHTVFHDAKTLAQKGTPFFIRIQKVQPSPLK